MRKRIKFYTAEHISNAVVKGLRLRGIDVLTTKESNMLGATDEEHLAFANKEGRIIFTQANPSSARIRRDEKSHRISVIQLKLSKSTEYCFRGSEFEIKFCHYPVLSGNYWVRSASPNLNTRTFSESI